MTSSASITSRARSTGHDALATWLGRRIALTSRDFAFDGGAK